MTTQEPGTPQSPQAAATAEATPLSDADIMVALTQEARKARSWFAFVAGLSLVNTVLNLLQVEWGFVIGLGATRVVDAIIWGARAEADPAIAAAITVVGVLINLFLIGLVALVWWLSGRGSTTAYLMGMICYALDGLIFVSVQDWFGVAFHIFFLIGMWKGYGALRAYAAERARQAYLMPGAQAPPVTLPPRSAYPRP
jgi:hypothetical protein